VFFSLNQPGNVVVTDVDNREWPTVTFACRLSSRACTLPIKTFAPFESGRPTSKHLLQSHMRSCILIWGYHRWIRNGTSGRALLR